MGHLTNCGGDGVVDTKKVVVGVQRKMIRVERTFGLSGRQCKGLRKGTFNRPERSDSQGRLLQKTTSAYDV